VVSLRHGWVGDGWGWGGMLLILWGEYFFSFVTQRMESFAHSKDATVGCDRSMRNEQP
jgi:hypothetical protein